MRASAQSIDETLVQAAQALAKATRRVRFPTPVAHVYQPLDYAWELHEAYVRRFASRSKEVLFLGMNPGTFGMMQTGVPFGEVATVRDWLKLTGLVRVPASSHPRRPILGLD